MVACYSYKQFLEEFPNEDVCLDKIFEMRYGWMKECPKCGNKKPYTRVKGRKAYQCSRWKCPHQIFPLKGSAFEATKIKLSLWLFVMKLFVNSKAGLTARFVAKEITISPKSALRMLRVIREHLQNDETPLTGEIEVDETMTGQKLGTMNLKKRAMIREEFKAKGKGMPRGRSLYNKSLILGMIQRGGRLIAKVVNSGEKKSLHPLIHKYVAKGSYLLTDEYPVYRSLNKHYIHEYCNHKRHEYVNGIASTNACESAWSRFKLAYRNYISVSKKYLPLYVKEFVFRFNNRKNGRIFHDLFDFLLHPDKDFFPSSAIA